jgi:hypothetical protein
MATFMDKLLFVSLTALTLILFFCVRELFPSGSIVEIHLNNKTLYILPLNKDRIVSVDGPIGKSIVEIKDGKVRMKSAPCPKKLCVHQGWIDRGAIVCIPNNLIVTISRKNQYTSGSGYDAVSR